VIERMPDECAIIAIVVAFPLKFTSSLSVNLGRPTQQVIELVGTIAINRSFAPQSEQIQEIKSI